MPEETDFTKFIGSDADRDIRKIDESDPAGYDLRNDIFYKQLGEERPRIYILGRWLIMLLGACIILSVIYGLTLNYDRYVHIVFISAGFLCIATIMAYLIHSVHIKRGDIRGKQR